MNGPKFKLTPPVSIRLEASTACQLKCLDCSQKKGQIRKFLGWGFLSFQNFKKIVDQNPSVCTIELSNWGEIFLNPELIDIIRYAYKKNVLLTASNGVNLNTMDAEMPEALVKYQFDRMTCSIDGASQKTYSIYRKGGSFEKVIENIKKINSFKARYGSKLPSLTWQFIPFSHNEHDILKAQKIAKSLDMDFKIKPPHSDRFSGPKTKSLVKKICGDELDIQATRMMCTLLWTQPQINFDGQLLGCCHIYKGSFGNVFKEGLLPALNNKKMTLARQMLAGKSQGLPGIPCVDCRYYKIIAKRKAWFKESDIKSPRDITREKIGLRRKLIKTLRSRLAQTNEKH